MHPHPNDGGSEHPTSVLSAALYFYKMYADVRAIPTGPVITKVYDPKYKLEEGLISKSGWSVIDDSASPLFDLDPAGDLIKDGWISSTPRTAGNVDMYVTVMAHTFRVW